MIGCRIYRRDENGVNGTFRCIEQARAKTLRLVKNYLPCRSYGYRSSGQSLIGYLYFTNTSIAVGLFGGVVYKRYHIIKYLYRRTSIGRLLENGIVGRSWRMGSFSSRSLNAHPLEM